MSEEIRYEYRPYIFRAKNGTEILIQVYVGDQLDEDGVPILDVRMATRLDRWSTWGAPLYFERAP